MIQPPAHWRAPLRSDRHFKRAIYEQFARIGKALASPGRLELLDLLCQGPRTVEVLAREANLSVANTSRHLQVLRRTGLVEGEREGVWVRYRVADEKVCEFLRALRVFGESRLAEVERVVREFLEERGAMERVDLESLCARMRRDEVILIDVRPAEEYRAGHIPGALSMPLGELEDRVPDLEDRVREPGADREIVAYCRGPYCVLAVKAVERLRALGFEAARLEEGVPDWRARGYPVTVGEVPD